MQYVLINLKVNQGYTDTIGKIMVTVPSRGNVGQAVLRFVCLFCFCCCFRDPPAAAPTPHVLKLKACASTAQFWTCFDFHILQKLL